MISVGINENVVLLKADTTEKGALQITFEEKASLEKTSSVFDDLQTAKVENDGQTSRSLLVFPFKKPTGVRNEGKTDDELIEMTSDDMKKVKNQLTQLLEQYLTSDKIAWDPYAGTGIDTTNYRQKFSDDDALAKVFENYANQFIAQASPFFGNKAYLLRVKLVRQSADKHFATIPGKFLVDNPWVELMEVPTARVKFTKWEIDNKLNDGTPIARPDAPTDLPAAEGSNVFGQR